MGATTDVIDFGDSLASNRIRRRKLRPRRCTGSRCQSKLQGMARVRVLLAAAVLVLLASACRIDATVDVQVADDGSGVVTLSVVVDAEAVDLIPDAPDALRLEDLGKAGWSVDGPDVDEAGSLVVTATKRFDSAESLPAVISEIAGAGLIFSDIGLTQGHVFDLFGLAPARTSYNLTGTVDPSPDLEAFGDDQLSAQLGLPLGRAVSRISADVGGPLTDTLGLTVLVHMPSGVSSTDESALVEGDTATFVTTFGDQPVSLDTSATVEDILPRVWAVVSLAIALALILVLLRRFAVWLLAILRTPKGRRRRDQRQREKRAATRAEEASKPRQRMLRLLVVDVHGVVVRPIDPFEGLLLPMITSEQPDTDPEAVREQYRKLILDRVSPSEFWSEVGLGPVAQEMETRYLSSFRLVPGLHHFLDQTAERGLPVAAIGNQPRAWGERLRRMAALESAVASWMVSGDVGQTLPEPALLEATRRVMSVDLFDCLYLSSVPENLDAAKEMGVATAYFYPEPGDPPETAHSPLRSFDELFRGRGN